MAYNRKRTYSWLYRIVGPTLVEILVGLVFSSCFEYDNEQSFRKTHSFVEFQLPEELRQRKTATKDQP